MRIRTLSMLLGLLCALVYLSGSMQAQGPGGITTRTFTYVSAAPSGACTNGQANQFNYLTGNEYGCVNGTWALVASSGGGSPVCGSNTQVIFNDSGVCGADAGFTYNKTTDSLTVAGKFTWAATGNAGCTMLTYAAWTCPDKYFYIYLDPSDLSGNNYGCTVGIPGQVVCAVTAQVDPTSMGGDMSGDYCNAVWDFRGFNPLATPTQKGGYDLGTECNYHNNGTLSADGFYLFSYADNTTVFSYQSTTGVFKFEKQTLVDSNFFVIGDSYQPLIYGNTTAGGSLTLQSTNNVATTTDSIIAKVGNSGAPVTAWTAAHSGAVVFGVSVTSPLYASTTNCADSAGAAACGAAPAGAVVIDAGASTVVVSTTAVTANSEIFLTFDSSLSTRLSITCNATVALPVVTARTAGASFTITVPAAPAVNPACFNYWIIN